MKVCDKHNEVPAAYTIEFGMGEVFDVCNDCAADIKKFMADSEMVVTEKTPNVETIIDNPQDAVVKKKKPAKKTRKKK